jgi:hypothetical protein
MPAGAFVGFDRQGGPNDDPVVPIVMSLIDAGYADHLLFSSEASCTERRARAWSGGRVAR